MANPVTEVVLLTLKLDAGFDTLKATVETLRVQPGCQRVDWAPESKNQSKVHLFIHWDSKEKRLEFAASPSYKEFVGGIIPILNAPPLSFHAELSPVHPRLFTSGVQDKRGVTEVLYGYFRGEDYLSELDKTSALTKFDKLLESVNNLNDAAQVVSSGRIQEEVAHEGQSGYTLLAIIAWQSPEAHAEYVDSEDFKGSYSVFEQSKGFRGTKSTLLK